MVGKAVRTRRENIAIRFDKQLSLRKLELEVEDNRLENQLSLRKLELEAEQKALELEVEDNRLENQLFANLSDALVGRLSRSELAKRQSSVPRCVLCKCRSILIKASTTTIEFSTRKTFPSSSFI
jgi:hypothetical protein